MVRDRDTARAVRTQTLPRDAGGATPREGLGLREGCGEGARHGLRGPWPAYRPVNSPSSLEWTP